MCLTAYLDESGTHGDSAAVSVAGYLSTPDRWVEFSREWTDVRERFHIPFFHMTDFANSAKQFAGWDEEMKRERLPLFLNVINKYTIASVGFVLPRVAFDYLISHDTADYMGGPYGLLAAKVFMEVGTMMCLTGVRGRVMYYYEDGAEGKGQVERLAHALQASPTNRERHRFLDLEFKDKVDFAPLQAADILAYELYRRVDEQLKESGRLTRYPLRVLAANPFMWDTIRVRDLMAYERVASLAASLDPKVLGSEPVKTWRRPENPRSISIAEFQKQWQWFAEFMGLVPMWATKG